MLPESENLDQDLDALLRLCVECGLCLPHCATFAGTGNEVQSPRGRLALLSHLQAGSNPEAPQAFLEAFDLCIGCRACEAVCPSGVPFQLLEHGQNLAAEGLAAQPVARMGLPGGDYLLRKLDGVSFLRFLGKSGSIARRTAAALLGVNWRQKMENGPTGKLARLLGSLPTAPESDRSLLEYLDRKCRQAPQFQAESSDPLPAAQSVPVPSRRQVAFFAGCANAGLLPSTSSRLLSLLEAAGCQVKTVASQDCCGALASHTGQAGRAASLRRKNLTAFAPFLTEDWCVLVEAAGCGLELRERYGEEMAARATDAIVLLAGLNLPVLGEVPLTVVYHDPCHARHGQGIIEEPRQLLRRIPGLQVVEPLEPEVCCGSGGTWGLTHPELSHRLGRRKARDLAATGADLVLTSNPGCLGQVADGLALEAPELPVLPLTDLLWYAWQKKPGQGASGDSR